MKNLRLLLPVSLALAALFAIGDARASETCSQSQVMESLLHSHDHSDESVHRALKALRLDVGHCEDTVDGRASPSQVRAAYRACIARTSESLGALRFALAPYHGEGENRLERDAEAALAGVYEKFRNLL